jgi:hypothetical protein
MSHVSPILLATHIQPDPTVFATVMRTYLACWQGNFGLSVHGYFSPRGGYAESSRLQGVRGELAERLLPSTLRNPNRLIASRLGPLGERCGLR